MDDYRPQPQGTLRLAQHMHGIGTLKMLPKAWTDYFFRRSRRTWGAASRWTGRP